MFALTLLASLWSNFTEKFGYSMSYYPAQNTWVHVLSPEEQCLPSKDNRFIINHFLAALETWGHKNKRNHFGFPLHDKHNKLVSFRIAVRDFNEKTM